MRIFYNLNDFLKSKFSSRKFVVTIGVFDGLHRAHQKIIKALMEKAGPQGLLSLLVTFNPHPLDIVNAPGRVPLLISLKHRLRLLEGMGLDVAIVLPFNRKLSRMSPGNFIKGVLGKIRISEIIVGENFLFGKNESGSAADLEKLSPAHGYKVTFVGDLKSSGTSISSTRIRNLILKGELAKASWLLSRPVTVLGTVVKGKRKGTIIGFPTANVDPHHEAVPPSGVYAVKMKLGRKVYNGILNIGVRPTFNKGVSREKDPTIEAHIFDFKRSIYGMDVEIIFIRKIRQERRFSGAAELKTQIKKDAICAKRALRA